MMCRYGLLGMWDFFFTVRNSFRDAGPPTLNRRVTKFSPTNVWPMTRNPNTQKLRWLLKYIFLTIDIVEKETTLAGAIFKS